MTTATPLLEARPQLRPDVLVGPAVRSGAVLVHNVKDARTGRYFQIGPREFFIVSRLDGNATLAQIGGEYAAAFGRRLDEQRWGQILRTLASRQLLTGLAEDPADGSGAAAPAPPQPRGPLYARLVLMNPGRRFAAAAPRLRFAFSPWFVVPALLAVLCVEVLVALAAPTLLGQARLLWDAPAAGIAVVVTLWLSVAVHEAAHGLTATHFGGTATEIGVLWRFPVLAPYCRTNDVLLFPRRRQRVATAFAGVFASLLLLIPVVPVWALAPAGGSLQSAAAALLLFGSLSAVGNFVPFLQLDGYHMLNHALGMQNLRVESYRFLGLALRSSGRRGNRGTGAYPRRVKVTYTLYGVGSVLFGAALAGWFIVWWFRLLEPTVGAPRASVVIAGMLLAGTALVVALRRQGAGGSAAGAGSARGS